METMRQDFEMGGYAVDVVAINIVGAESSQASLTALCTFDLLQDVVGADVWTLMGGKKDDIFVYRQGGVLAPSGYLANTGADVNDSGKVDVADAIGVLSYVFADGLPPLLGTTCVPMQGCPASCAR